MHISRGAILRIWLGETKLKATLQVLEIRRAPAALHGAVGPEKYRVVLSDGLHSLVACWPVLLNEDIRQHRVHVYSMVQLQEFSIQCMNHERVIIIHKVKVQRPTQSPPSLIGNPQHCPPLPGPLLPSSSSFSSPPRSSPPATASSSSPEAAASPSVPLTPRTPSPPSSPPPQNSSVIDHTPPADPPLPAPPLASGAAASARPVRTRFYIPTGPYSSSSATTTNSTTMATSPYTSSTMASTETPAADGAASARSVRTRLFIPTGPYTSSSVAPTETLEAAGGSGGGSARSVRTPLWIPGDPYSSTSSMAPTQTPEADGGAAPARSVRTSLCIPTGPYRSSARSGGSSSMAPTPAADGSCVICFAQVEEKVAFVHGSTAHQCCCHDCATSWFRSTKRCPICRRMSTVVRIYSS